MGGKSFESAVGAFVLLMCAIVLGFAYNQVGTQEMKGNLLNTRFSSATGLINGSEVRINGVKVGTVLEERLDPQRFDVILSISVNSEYFHVPADTIATVSSDGLLGSNFLKLEPGQSPSVLKPRETISHVRDSKPLSEQINQIISLATGGESLN